MNIRRNNPRREARAFTIIEVIVIVTIIGIIAAVVGGRLFGKIGVAKQSVAKANAATLANAVKTFMIDHGKLPAGANIHIVWERPSDVAADKWQPYVDNADALLDPWGHEFILVVPGQKNIDFDVVSYGADGQPGGTDEDADIIAP